MITHKVMIGLYHLLDGAIHQVEMECSDHSEGHTVPVDVWRANTRFGISEYVEEMLKTDGHMTQVARVVLNTHFIGRQSKTFLGGMITDLDGNEVAGGLKDLIVSIHFLSTDWYDLFGKDIAWAMAEYVEGLLYDRFNGIWDSYLEANGAELLRKDYDSLNDGMLKNLGIENLYLVTLGFKIKDQRFYKRKDVDYGGDEPIEAIKYEVMSK